MTGTAQTLAIDGLGSLEVLDLPGAADRPALILLHEGLGSVDLWRGFPDRLAATTGNRVIAYSRHGHGDSDPPPRPRTPSFMEEEAREVLPALVRALALDRPDPILVGHSDGASIALLYAAQHPVSAAIAIAPHVFVEEFGLAEIRNAKQIYETGDLRARMARRHRDPDVTFYGWSDVWLHPDFPGWDIRAMIAPIRCPVLLIQGEQDQYGTMAQLDEAEAAITGPVDRVHLECKHSPHLEAPEATLDATARFVARVGAPVSRID